MCHSSCKNRSLKPTTLPREFEGNWKGEGVVPLCTARLLVRSDAHGIYYMLFIFKLYNIFDFSLVDSPSTLEPAFDVK